ncbi:RNA polymerase subunit sigma-70 [Spongiactinospora sp. TRM90649]|uniref:RNA polymerase subunit sigma-70 n=1 Tax=Spongiactinospora sp. TRM90649 TaxID=3031114 RepID=UPI0023F6F32F|nr:RNA polymerase subunit sigma-70 [Spongiactinospora sp. TRM90649]MDF5751759.1 RNA polymerase subunit sigma-70 [Spongiactinospora sp. TRM90649]
MVEGAPGEDARAFERLVERYRGELAAHCYRMLGSPHDAEDALQEALLAAWRGIGGFAGRSSLRTWLYRVTTNVCLRMSEQRARRLRSTEYGPPCPDTAELGEPVSGPVWLEPWPDDEVAGGDPGPEAGYLRREGVELAFVAALQRLPGRQRAVLILREVLGYSAAEVARILDASPAAVNSALQRARRTLGGDAAPGAQRAERAALGPDGERALIEAFVAAWERADVPALVAMLADDARFTMPPLPAWFEGRAAVAAFMADRLFETAWRLRPIRANDQPAFACYQHDLRDDAYRLAAITVLGLRAGKITEIAGFVDPEVGRLFARRLGLPLESS